jgi:hypothetical protein
MTAIKKEKGRSKKGTGEYVVHEFEKSTAQPSFLRQDAGLGIRGNLEYVDGQGWVDEAGHVVEEESDRVLRLRATTKPAAYSSRRRTKPSDHSSASSTPPSSGDSVSEIGGKSESTSSSGSSSGSDSGAETDGSVPDKDTALPDNLEGSEQSAVHPLEALFKKPKKPASQDVAKPSLELATSFSFFETEDQDDNEGEANIPGTPFSSLDFGSRGLRSAAPTPDTAHPSRFSSYGSSGLPGDEESEDDDNRAAGGPVSGEPSKPRKHDGETPSRQQSEFEKTFWKNRADNNRAWKLRRRTVLKEKRQRENKARRPKNW